MKTSISKILIHAHQTTSFKITQHFKFNISCYCEMKEIRSVVLLIFYSQDVRVFETEFY
jgi:hypothetical protein